MEHASEQLRECQANLSEVFAQSLAASELDHLRTLTRLAFEFAAYLAAGSRGQDAARYRAESVLAGVDSLYPISSSYRFLREASTSRITWDIRLF
jgi:hypothetical protein